jgi:2'-5' RNA ligase
VRFPFDADVYLVLELPEPVAREVLARRRKYGDVFRSALPAEITVAGSGGVGCIAEDQDPDQAWATLADIAAATAPITSALGEVLRFPGTNLFVFRPQPDEALRVLHEQIAGSPIRFRPNRFPYTPHCTLRGGGPVTDTEAAAIQAERVPGRFTLRQMSVYRLQPWPSDDVPVDCRLIRRWELREAAGRR